MQAYAIKKAALLSDEDYRTGGDGGFQIVAVGESPFDHNRPSLRAWPTHRRKPRFSTTCRSEGDRNDTEKR